MGDHRLNAKETFYLNVYRLQRMDAKGSRARVAFALLSALAICCSVMYITADGDAETVLAARGYTPRANKFIGSGYDIRRPRSIESVDVKKAGMIVTNTPDGRMRLLKYLNKVEKQIAKESAGRRADIAAIRAHMARNFAFNQAARATMKKQLLAKMAINAKAAKDSLDRNMRRVQRQFAAHAELANKRNKATIARSNKTREIMRKNKREAANNLKLAVQNQQRALSALASATNAKIKRTNKHIAANAAQIKENAKKARKDLEVAMHDWDHKIATFRETSANARSKLQHQFEAQDKATRAWANNKIKGLVASTSAQFDDVNTKMAKNRHEVDMALRQATMRFEASLNAAKALEDARYAQNVADIAAAKKEAASKVAAASSEFKIALLSLGSTVKEQVHKINARIDVTADVVRSDAAEQAKVNNNVNAEMTRMVKLGNKRYKEHLKNDVELQSLISKDKAETDEKLNKMALEFNTALANIRKTLAKDRKHAEDELNKQTGAVWKQLYKQQEMQAKKNADMEAATRRMRLDAMDAVREAKKDFQKKIKDLGTIVDANDKKADAGIEKLTGIVTAEALKSKKGREEIAQLEEANKKELKHAIQKAIKTGEKRAKLVEERGVKMDKDTKWLINHKLREETDASVESLALLNKEAREQQKKEMLYA